MNNFFKFCVMSLCLSGALYVPKHTFAQNRPNAGESAAQKLSAPEEFTQKPVSFHGLKLFTGIAVTGKYDDNIYRQSNHETSDYILQTSPYLNLRNENGRHEFEIDLNAKDSRYKDTAEENTTEYFAGIKANIEATHKLSFPLSLHQRNIFISREQPGSTSFTEEPIALDETRATAGINYRFNRLNFELLSNYSTYRYEDGVSRLNGQPVILAYNNRDEFLGRARIMYEVLGNKKEPLQFLPFVEVSYRDITYQRDQLNGTSGDAQEYGGRIGFKADYKSLLLSDFRVGISRRDYLENQFEDVQRLVLDGFLGYQPSKRLALSLDAKRDFNDNNSFIEGYVETDIDLTASYEVMHNFYTDLLLGYNNKELLGVGTDLDTYSGGIKFRYAHGPRLESNVSINHSFRESNVPTSEYDQNTIMYTLIARY